MNFYILDSIHLIFYLIPFLFGIRRVGPHCSSLAFRLLGYGWTQNSLGGSLCW